MSKEKARMTVIVYESGEVKAELDNGSASYLEIAGALDFVKLNLQLELVPTIVKEEQKEELNANSTV